MVVSGAATAVLCGCSALTGMSPEAALAGDQRVNPAGANVLLDKGVETFTDARLVSMIYPGDGSARCKYEKSDTDVPGAITCFTLDPDNVFKDDTVKQEYRNAVQYTLMMASDNRCNLYYTYVARAGAIEQGTTSVLSTVFGGVGAIVTGNASRIFSGLSGISSGVGANINAAMFHNVAESVLIPAMRQARTAKRKEINDDATETLTKYPITRAISDALEYHGLCNVSAALTQAQESIQKNAPGQ